jgi:molecular chaperone GrpE
MTEEATPDQAPAAEPAAAPDPAALRRDMDGLRAELEQARKEAAEAGIRARAELENQRRRLERDADNARRFALEKFAGELLGVVDSLERGLAAVNAEDEALRPAREGLELTLRQLLDSLRKFEVEPVDPKGAAFDPQFHEAMAQIPNGEVAPNTVIDVMQKGFLLSGRLLRPALVVVSRAP